MYVNKPELNNNNNIVTKKAYHFNYDIPRQKNEHIFFQFFIRTEYNTINFTFAKAAMCPSAVTIPRLADTAFLTSSSLSKNNVFLKINLSKI